MTHPFETYRRKHSHYPRLRFDDGYNRLTVEFAPGYVRIQSGLTVIWIRRSTFLAMLRRAVPLCRRWTSHPDHDVPAAMHESYLFEKILLEERRQAKKAHREDYHAREKQRRRFLRAQARRSRRQETE